MHTTSKQCSYLRKTMKKSLPLLVLWVLSRKEESTTCTQAFLLTERRSVSGRGRVESLQLDMVASTGSRGSDYPYDDNRRSEKDSVDEHFLMKQFVTASGEVINPYNVLQISRNADRAAIKGSYKQLARRYHPDGARNRTILPGKCNNEQEVREEWERIQIAYQILIDDKTRKRYDRNEMIADPGAAMRRAAMGATMKGVSSIGRGLFSLGQKAVEMSLQSKSDKDNGGDKEIK